MNARKQSAPALKSGHLLLVIALRDRCSNRFTLTVRIFENSLRYMLTGPHGIPHALSNASMDEASRPMFYTPGKEKETIKAVHAWVLRTMPAMHVLELNSSV